MRQVQLR